MKMILDEAERESCFCGDTRYCLLKAGWKIKDARCWLACLCVARRQERSGNPCLRQAGRYCGNTNYRLLDMGMIKFLFPVFSSL